MWLENKFTPASTLRLQAVSYAEEFIEASKTQDSSQGAVLGKWSRPLNSMVKMNVAWTPFKNRKSIGMGLVIRDYLGELLAKYCEDLKYRGDQLHQAALSLIHALQFALEAGFQKLLVAFTDARLGVLLLSKDKCLT